MIELPEVVNLAKQLTETLKGKRIAAVVAGFSPHKFAFYYGDPKDYDALLRGKTIDTVVAYGDFVAARAADIVLLFVCVVPRFHTTDEQRPWKHQLLIEFEDGTAISATASLYAELACFKEGEYHNPYYDAAISDPPSPPRYYRVGILPS
jgi:formamidopyrimidine-DNA glycosylase